MAKKPFTKAQKELIIRCFSDSTGMRWPDKIAMRYFYELRQHSGAKPSEIPLNAGRSRKEGDLLRILRKHDPELEIFRKYLKSSEAMDRKSLQFFKLPDSCKQELASAWDQIEELQYSEDIEGKWKIRAATKTDDYAEFHLTKKGIMRRNLNLKSDSISESLRKEVVKVAKQRKLIVGKDDVTKCNITLAIDQRNVQTILVNKESQEIVFSMGEPEVEASSDGQVIPAIDTKSHRAEAFRLISEHLKLEESKEEFENIPENNADNPFSESALEELSNRQKKDRVIIMNVRRYEKEGENHEDHLADITVRFPLLDTIVAIQKAIREFLEDPESKNSLKGFLERHQNYDTNRQETVDRLNQDKKSQKKSNKGFFFYVRRPAESEKVPSGSELKDGRMIDYLKFSIDADAGSLRIENKGYTEDTYDAFLREIQNLA